MFWPFITFLYKMTDKTQRQWRERQEISWRGRRKDKTEKIKTRECEWVETFH